MEKAVQFHCDDKRLYGVLHISDDAPSPIIVVALVTGGPQVRFGGHRLFVQLARHLCRNGIAVFRFDYEGMGDSDGDLVGFMGAGRSIDAAINFLSKSLPNFQKAIIWSLCDGCPISIAFAAYNQSRIAGLIMCNPFILDNKAMEAQAHLRHHYARRLGKKDFWNRLFSMKMNLVGEVKIIISSLIKVFWYHINGLGSNNNSTSGSLESLVLKGIIRFPNPICFIFSTDDIVGMEFRNLLLQKRKIRRSINTRKIKQHIIKDADHTFTDPEKKKELFETTLHAVREIASIESNEPGVAGFHLS